MALVINFLMWAHLKSVMCVREQEGYSYKMLGKKLDANFEEVKKWQEARYLIHDDGDV